MVMSPERSGRTSKYLRVGLLSFAVLLAACGNDGREDTSSPTTQYTPDAPTAQELAYKKGGSVSQFPALEEGAEGMRRFCIEMGGEVTGLSATVQEGQLVDCRVGDKYIQMNPNAIDESFLSTACKTAGGKVVQVATAADSIYTVAACHTGIPPG